MPRPYGQAADIGAYESQIPSPYAEWLLSYGLPTDGSADAMDEDGDGLNTWQEWRCLTNPTNALSVLRLLSAMPDRTNVTVTWQSNAGVSYFLERCTNLALLSYEVLAPNILGQSETTTFTDTNAPGSSTHFYRVGVAN